MVSVIPNNIEWRRSIVAVIVQCINIVHIKKTVKHCVDIVASLISVQYSCRRRILWSIYRWRTLIRVPETRPEIGFLCRRGFSRHQSSLKLSFRDRKLSKVSFSPVSGYSSCFLSPHPHLSLLNKKCRSCLPHASFTDNFAFPASGINPEDFTVM